MSRVQISYFPGVIARSALIAGLAPPDLDRPFVYTELGCGDGATLICLAASFPECTFYGTGYSAQASARADAAGLTNLNFAELADVPPCDYVAFRDGGDAGAVAAATALLNTDGLLQIVTEDTATTLGAAEAAGLAMIHAEQEYLALTFTKPGEDGFKRGNLMMRGGDIVGFSEPARWSERVDAPEDPLSEFSAALDDQPMSLGPVMQRGMGGGGPMEEVEAVANMIAQAILHTGGLPYAGPAIAEDLPKNGTIAASHALTDQILAAPEACQTGCHLPSPVLGGGVALSPTHAALLRATLEGTPDRAAHARSLLPADTADPAQELTVFDRDWLPFLARLGVIKARPA